MVVNATFKIKHSKLKGMQEKESAPLLFAYGKNKFSHDMAHLETETTSME